MKNNIDDKKQQKLFGVKNRAGKAIILILFCILTGGLGLLVLLAAFLGDCYLLKRSKKAKAS